MKNGKPYKYNSKDRLKKSSGKKDTKKKSKPTENTINIDTQRLNDLDLLDTSFLEGRIDTSITKPKANNKKQKKDNKNDKNKKIKKESVKQKISNNELLKRVHFLRNLFFVLALVCIFIFVTIFSFNMFKKAVSSVMDNKNKKVEVVTSKKDKDVIDRNYLFVGDYLTDEFIFSKYEYDYHYVKSTKRDLTTNYIIDNGKSLIYDYNPSIIFLEVGLFDLDNSISTDELVNNIDTIVKQIKDNRPNTDIYIESIYPVNSSVSGYKLKPYSSDITNEMISEANSAIKNYCKENKINYLDVHSMLVKKNKLDAEYTDNGFSLNSKGYKQVSKMINKVIGD